MPGEIWETAWKIATSGSNICENAQRISYPVSNACECPVLIKNLTENAKKIRPKSNTIEILKPETPKTMTLLLSFETAEKIMSYESVKAILISSYDFYLNKTTMNETARDLSNYIVCAQS